MNFWFLWMPNSTREMTLGWWPWTELLGDPSLPCSASACGVCARAHTGVRVCAWGCDELVTHLLVGMTAVMGDLSSKCSIIYPNEIVGKQKGVLPVKSGWSSQTSTETNTEISWQRGRGDRSPASAELLSCSSPSSPGTPWSWRSFSLLHQADKVSDAHLCSSPSCTSKILTFLFRERLSHPILIKVISLLDSFCKHCFSHLYLYACFYLLPNVFVLIFLTDLSAWDNWN